MHLDVVAFVVEVREELVALVREERRCTEVGVAVPVTGPSSVPVILGQTFFSAPGVTPSKRRG